MKPGTDHGDGIAGLNATDLEPADDTGPGLDGHGCLVGDGVGNAVGVDGEMGGADPVILAERTRIEPGGGIIGIAGEVTAQRPMRADAADVVIDEQTLADLELADVGAHRHHLAHRFVAENLRLALLVPGHGLTATEA